MRKYMLYSCLLGALATAVFSCKKDQTTLTNINNATPVNEQQVRQDIQNALKEIQKVQGVDMGIHARMVAQFIVVPAGSNNALAQALTDADTAHGLTTVLMRSSKKRVFRGFMRVFTIKVRQMRVF